MDVNIQVNFYSKTGLTRREKPQTPDQNKTKQNKQELLVKSPVICKYLLD